MSHSDVLHINGSFFQGHAASVHSIEEAIRARDGLFQNMDVAKSDSIMYAYKTYDPISHDQVSGFSDDREWGGGKVLNSLREDSKQDSVFLAVSRRHNALNLGPARFDHIISKVASVALAKERDNH